MKLLYLCISNSYCQRSVQQSTWNLQHWKCFRKERNLECCRLLITFILFLISLFSSFLLSLQWKTAKIMLNLACFANLTTLKIQILKRRDILQLLMYVLAPSSLLLFLHYPYSSLWPQNGQISENTYKHLNWTFLHFCSSTNNFRSFTDISLFLHILNLKM